MKNVEYEVVQVLKALNQAQPPAGMESRILLTLEQRAARVQAGWRWWKLTPVRALGLGGACAGLACSVSWITTSHRITAPRPVSYLSAARQTSTQPATVGALLPPKIIHAPGKVYALNAFTVDKSDVLAGEETNAPSHPAPPLPLTQQERLLLSVVSRHDPDQVAALDPEVRGKQELRAKVEFQNFFEPVVPLEEKSSAKTINDKGDTR